MTFDLNNLKKNKKPGPSKKAWISETSCSFEINLIPSNGSEVISDISLITRLITWGGIFSAFLERITKWRLKKMVK